MASVYRQGLPTYEQTQYQGVIVIKVKDVFLNVSHPTFLPSGAQRARRKVILPLYFLQDDALEKSTQKMASKKTKLSSGTVVNNIRPSMTR